MNGKYLGMEEIGFKDCRMTIGQIKKAAKGKKYMLFTNVFGNRMAINTRIFNLKKMNSKPDSTKTDWIGWEDISFQEYISKKGVFIVK